MGIVAFGALGVVFTVVPLAVLYATLVKHYDGASDATAFRWFRWTFALGSVAVTAGAAAAPLAVRATIETGPALFAPLLDLIDELILSGLGVLTLALAAYLVADRRT